MQVKRLIQLATGVHRIHHPWHSYGWKLPFSRWAYFDRYGWRRLEERQHYHDCTRTGTY
jgi:hypothetical protein